MKILHVITSLRTGGAEQLMVHLLPQLKARGFEVDLCLFDGTNTYFRQQIEAKGIRIIDFGEGNSVYNPMNIIRLRKLIKNYDIIHTHNYSPQIYGVLANIGLGVKMVTTEHNTSNRRRSIKGFAAIDRLMYSRYDRIICISKKAEDNLRDFIGSQSKKIITINNGIETKTYATATPLLDLKPSGVIALTMVAGFRPQKDQVTLIKALNYLPEKFHLYLIGDGVKRVECERLAYNLGLDGRVHFMGIRTDVPSILKSSDYIVMSSHFEGLSLSSLEGMCVGKPFIASDVDGLHEVVDGAGILFPHQDAKALAEEVLSLDRDHSRYMEVAETCLRHAMQYDIAGMVNGYEQIYRTL